MFPFSCAKAYPYKDSFTFVYILVGPNSDLLYCCKNWNLQFFLSLNGITNLAWHFNDVFNK